MHKPARVLLSLFILAAFLGLALSVMAPGTAWAAPADGQQEDTQQAQDEQAEGEEQEETFFLDPSDFNIFGEQARGLMSTPFGRWMAQMSLRVVVPVFQASVVLGSLSLLGRFFLLMIGKAPRESIVGRILDLVIGVLGAAAILTGALAWMLNSLLKGATEIQRDLSAVPPPAVVVQAEAPRYPGPDPVSTDV